MRPVYQRVSSRRGRKTTRHIFSQLRNCELWAPSELSTIDQGTVAIDQRAQDQRAQEIFLRRPRVWERTLEIS